MILLVTFASAMPSPTEAGERPHRIVSLNLCTDYLLWRLADRDQIASLSYLAADPSESLIASEIKGVPLNYGRGEEVRLIDPDLVLAGTYGARFAVGLLKSRGFKVVEIKPADGVDDIAPEIEEAGAAIGQAARAQAMASTVRERLAALRADIPRHKVTAIVFQPRGFAAGAPSLADDVLTLSGARNLAAESGFKSWAPIGVEGLLELDPELVVLDSPPNALPSISSEVLDHRALRYFFKQKHILRVDGNLWSCGVPETLSAVDQIRRAIQAQSAETSSFDRLRMTEEATSW
ncbi:MAG TPA: ABC transporter substrate-binding protein [Alphaproteobacteria bacterium]|nr:ABC transporter substrate-binding protein [Alphaproteobacteria bacterium]